MDSNDLGLVLSFLDGKTDEVPVEQIVDLQKLTARATSALARSYNGSRNKVSVLENRLSRMQRRSESKEREAVASEEAFADLGLDSLDIADALAAHLRQLKTYQMGKDKVSLILFEIYASWLHGRKERVCVEHPVATPYGPRLWRAYTRMNLNAGDEAVAKLNALNPGLSVMVGNAARKYYDYSLSDLERYLKRSAPYRNASPKEEGGKWNGEITDSDIYTWKASLRASSK